jgi:hypothetical protein
VHLIHTRPAFESIVPFKEDEAEPDYNARPRPRLCFGLFARRCFLSFVKLSAPGLDLVAAEYAAWRAGAPRGPHAVFAGANAEAALERACAL